MSLNTWDNQAKKSKATALQTKAHSLPAGQSEVSERARREKKWMRQGHGKASPATSQEDASEANVTPAENAQREVLKKRRQNSPTKRDISKIKCYNCNKKGYYAKYYTKPKD